MFSRAFRLAAIASLAAILMIPAAIPVLAASSRSTTTVSINSGKVVAGGADISLTYDCFPGGYGPYSSFGNVRVAQVSGATGSTFFHARCNDRRQTQAIFVPGNFRRADAAVGAFVCGFDCNATSKEIRLR